MLRAMTYVALVGPEIEENLSLRYIASSLAKAGVKSELVPFNFEGDFASAMATILEAPEPPIAVGISLAFQWRARDFLALAVALREGGYRGHITMGGHFGTFAAKEILADFPEIDSIVRQEAEDTMVALVSALENKAPLTAIPGLDCSHSGLCHRDRQGVLRYLHASSTRKEVVLAEELSVYLTSVSKHTGIMVARPLATG